jgi:hypothetical protein
MSNILKIEPLFNYFSNNFKKLSLSLACFLTAKLKSLEEKIEIIADEVNEVKEYIPATLDEDLSEIKSILMQIS